jgi:sugar lactone lactonase YvrE
VLDSRGGLYFTDSGAFGETGLHNPAGSLFHISQGRGHSHSHSRTLKPIALETLASPWGLAISPDDRFIYVAECMANRVLRFTEHPAGSGVLHGSVYLQLSGKIGPSALACDRKGTLYVAHYDIAGSSQEGVVYAVSGSGKVVCDISVPGPEITGLAIRYELWGGRKHALCSTLVITARRMRYCTLPSEQRALYIVWRSECIPHASQRDRALYSRFFSCFICLCRMSCSLHPFPQCHSLVHRPDLAQR